MASTAWQYTLTNVAISGMQKIKTRSDVQAMDIMLDVKPNQEECFGGSGEMEEN